MEFIQYYEVQKGRTVTCKMGVAHAGAKLSIANFSGDDKAAKQKIIDALLEIKAIKRLPPSEDEKRALVEAESARKKEADEKEKRKNAILNADFDAMNKTPMIEFAEKWNIPLKGKTAEEIRSELNQLKG